MTNSNKDPATPDASPDADWLPHDGSAKRPKGVGKRDAVRYKWVWGDQWGIGGPFPANSLFWEIITHYRITERAPKKEKRRKEWLLEGPWNEGFEVVHDPFGGSLEYVMSKRERGYKLYTAKFKEVKE